MDAADILTIARQVLEFDVSAVATVDLGDAALAVELLRNTVEALSAALLADLHDRGPRSVGGGRGDVGGGVGGGPYRRPAGRRAAPSAGRVGVAVAARGSGRVPLGAVVA